jgi:hypothetical protein
LERLDVHGLKMVDDMSAGYRAIPMDWQVKRDEQEKALVTFALPIP